MLNACVTCITASCMLVCSSNHANYWHKLHANPLQLLEMVADVSHDIVIILHVM